jgi:energy-coupling factor transporter ATP-binding protein EcfA2
MKITSLKYSEFSGEAREWELDEFSLGPTTLMVGKNSSGKTRALNVIIGLARLISGKQREFYESGTYDATFEIEGSVFRYQLKFANKKVESESLEVDGAHRFDRGIDGRGTIFAVKLDSDLEISMPGDALVVLARRDNVQHPFLEPMHRWADSARHYEFGTTLGRTNVTPLLELLSKQEDDLDAKRVVDAYTKGFRAYGQDFDAAILADFAALGYECTEVGIEQLDIPNLPTLGVLYVKEADIRSNTTQITMSQGMFRALGMVILLNYSIFAKISGTILIDDIGEGLDFDRSKLSISLLISRAEEAGLQLIMTTNDRFVMNGVDLRKWAVISRKGHRVHVYNKSNSARVFDEFASVGLNNFDFFSTGFFEQVVE